MSKLNNYTKGKFNFHILWQTRKIETLFKLKDKNIHPSHVIYIGTCTCNQAYIGETARNLEVRVNKHSDINKQSEPAKHLKTHPKHKFTWDTAHSWTKRKIEEAFYIARFNPVLNKQESNHSISLYTPWELALCNHKYKTVGLCNFITLKMIARSKTFSQTF